ncbi:MAG: response regulator transcription factor [Chitinophagaceae bacterium]
MEKITILIADDHTLIRDTWTCVLNSDPKFEVVAECGSAEEAITLTKELRPQIILLDINLPGISGIEATPLIRNYSPGTKILAVSMHQQPAYAQKIIRQGAMGYVTKNSTKQELFQAIIEIHKGKKYICREIKNIVSELIMGREEQPRGLGSLSQREIETVGLIQKGLSSKQIANAMNISVRTVEVHRYNILKKLDLKNAVSLINFINSNNLLMAV